MINIGPTKIRTAWVQNVLIYKTTAVLFVRRKENIYMVITLQTEKQQQETGCKDMVLFTGW